MFICHIFILLGFGSGVQFPIYIFTYPVVYPLIAIILTRLNPRLWLTNAILANALPFIYWYLLLWSDGKMNIQGALNLRESSGMLLIMPVTLGLACITAFAASRLRGSTLPRPGPGGGSQQAG
jgi:hypothetical protein